MTDKSLPPSATYDESKEPKSFERCGPFVIDYKRCYSGFGTAVKHNGVEYIVVCPDYGKLEDLVTETLGARIEQGFFRVIVAPESKASVPSETPQKLTAKELDYSMRLHGRILILRERLKSAQLPDPQEITKELHALEWAVQKITITSALSATPRSEFELDAQRLDWIEAKRPTVSFADEHFSSPGGPHVCAYPENPSDESNHYYGATFREALDNAMKGTNS